MRRARRLVLALEKTTQHTPVWNYRVKYSALPMRMENVLRQHKSKRKCIYHPGVVLARRLIRLVLRS